MRVLIYTPKHPTYGIRLQTVEAVHAMLAATAEEADWWLDDGVHEHPKAYQNIAANYNAARARVLEEGYDALLTIEADMIPPRDAIDRLLATGADVAYGLYIFRQGKQWSAYEKLGLFRAISISRREEMARATWGSVVDVAGLGMGCTLIRRHVLAALHFRLYEGEESDWIRQHYEPVARRYRIRLDGPRYMMANDWIFAMDAAHAGYRQVCDTSVVCGHVDGDTVLWPDPAGEKLYRSVPLGAETMPARA